MKFCWARWNEKQYMYMCLKKKKNYFIYFTSVHVVACLTQMLQANFRRSVVMICVTPNFSTHAYIERIYENPVKIQRIVWLRLWNTVYPIVTRSILRGTWKGIVCLASSEMVKGYTMFFLKIVDQIGQCFSFQACFSLWYSLNYLQDKGKLYDTSHLHLLTNWPCHGLRRHLDEYTGNVE